MTTLGSRAVTSGARVQRAPDVSGLTAVKLPSRPAPLAGCRLGCSQQRSRFAGSTEWDGSAHRSRLRNVLEQWPTPANNAAHESGPAGIDPTDLQESAGRPASADDARRHLKPGLRNRAISGSRRSPHESSLTTSGDARSTRSTSSSPRPQRLSGAFLEDAAQRPNT
jgi:hypothetical protein